ncbi:hypothetical protein [Roseateles sp.]|uniref:hypothetical protein n=1 Tax=Roseateles sp. TaxID=1971397 RepID=UPI003940DBAF
MSALFLPNSAWVPVTTQRLRAPKILWTGPDAESAGFDPGSVYCCPTDYEPAGTYTDETRLEVADRYGGIGIGNAGGSGRCSASSNGLQTKGVGVTPLVGPGADKYHSSGTLMLADAAAEAVYAGAYQAALPFGAVPVLALVATGGEYVRNLDHESQKCPRTLAIRPLVARPAHFMRNLLHPAGRVPAGSSAPGWTVDAVRTKQALALLATNLKLTLGPSIADGDEIAVLNAGLREVVRRFAWQCAAGFAKRLPHSTLGCSNIALSGAYLDFGLSNFVPAYRRLMWATGQDSWTEAQMPLNTLMTLRQQLGKYHLGKAATDVVSPEDMAAQYGAALQERLAIEMARMGGLTEDLVAGCPPELLRAWFAAMQAIWTRGADERFVNPPGHMKDGGLTPAPRKRVQYDLNAVLTAAGPHGDALAMDAALRPLLDDGALRHKFVTTALAVRAWVRAETGVPAEVLNSYLGQQATRKNAELDLLRRETTSVLGQFRELEAAGDIERVGPEIDAALRQARHGLADLCPELPGSSGLDQLAARAGLREVAPSRVLLDAETAFA